jgi:hypothetical protein
MGEIYRDSTNKGVTLDIAGASAVAAKFVRAADEYDASLSGNLALVPYEITRLGGDFKVIWTYTVGTSQFTRTDTHSVVSPMFTKTQLVGWDSDFGLLDDQAVVRLESIIRTIIQNYTGQKFTYEYDSVVFKGSGGETVRLPKRLVEPVGLNDRTGDLLDSWVASVNDGWGLVTNSGSSWVDNFYSSNPIQNPWRKLGYFREDTTYVLTGYFGYESIPEDVLKAAMILAEDYGCDESLWRDRYIANIRAADWRFEFNSKTFLATGNVKADQILQKYRLERMVVL